MLVDKGKYTKSKICLYVIPIGKSRKTKIGLIEKEKNS